MINTVGTSRGWAPLMAVIGLVFTAISGPAGIGWNKDTQRLEADLEAQPLPVVLETLAAATGWEIYVAPDASRTVSVRFRDLEIAQALPRLLGNLSFALIGSSGGRTRLYVFEQSMGEATLLLSGARAGSKAQLIPTELIVSLGPDGDLTIDELAKRLDAQIVGRLDDRGLYRLRFVDEAATERARQTLSEIAETRIDSNYRLRSPTQRNELLGPLSGALPLKPKVVPNADYFVVAVLDTPVSTASTLAKDFLLPAVSVSGASVPAAEPLSHGTAVAETLLRGLASTPQDPEGTPVRILPVDIYGESPTTTTFEVAQGIYAAARNGAQIINLSLGSDTDSPFLRSLILDVSAQGSLVVAAAGNDPVDTPVYPAAYPEVLAVTAGDRQGNIEAYANRGSFVDVIAPGTTVIHADGQTYLASGTSYATAYVSGITAGVSSSTGKPPREVPLDLIPRVGTDPGAGE